MPKILADKIEEVIASDKHGFTSVPDFIKEATRRYLRELGYLSLARDATRRAIGKDEG